MGETVKQLYNGSVPESLYNSTKERLEYLEGLVGNLATDKIKQLNKELETARTERDNYKGQVEQIEKRIAEIKEQYEKQISNLNKAHEDGKARQRGKWENDVNYYIRESNKYKTELDKCKAELTRVNTELEKSNKQTEECKAELNKEMVKVGLLETMNNKLDTVLKEIANISNMLIELSNNNSTKEEVIEAVKKKVNNISNIDIAYECEQIYIMTYKGLKVKEIAEELYPGVERGPSKVSERKQHEFYKSITGVIKNDEGVITGVLRE